MFSSLEKTIAIAALISLTILLYAKYQMNDYEMNSRVQKLGSITKIPNAAIQKVRPLAETDEETKLRSSFIYYYRETMTGQIQAWPKISYTTESERDFINRLYVTDLGICIFNNSTMNDREILVDSLYLGTSTGLAKLEVQSELVKKYGSSLLPELDRVSHSLEKTRAECLDEMPADEKETLGSIWRRADVAIARQREEREMAQSLEWKRVCEGISEEQREFRKSMGERGPHLDC